MEERILELGDEKEEMDDGILKWDEEGEKKAEKMDEEIPGWEEEKEGGDEEEKIKYTAVSVLQFCLVKCIHLDLFN